jgi:hypothetical protein
MTIAGQSKEITVNNIRKIKMTISAYSRKPYPPPLDLPAI